MAQALFAVPMNNSAVLELIRLYKENPCLWDSRDNDYKNRNRKNVILADIGRKMGIAPDLVERKLNILRTQYRREKKKFLHLYRAGLNLEDCYRRKWFAFDAMSFVDDFPNDSLQDKLNRIQSADADAPDDAPKKEIPFTRDDDSMQLTITSVSTLAEPEAAQDGPTKQSAFSKRPAGCPDHCAKLDELHDFMLSLTNASDRNESNTFGEHVGFRLHRLSKRARAVAINKINGILFEADMGAYEG